MTLAQAQLYALVVVFTSSAALYANASVESQATDTIVDTQKQETEQTKTVLTQAQKEKEAEKLLLEFMNLKKNQKKTFAQYSTELIKLLKDHPKFTDFVNALSKILDCKDPILVSMVLYEQQNKLPESIKTILKNKNRKELMDILRKRLK